MTPSDPDKEATRPRLRALDLREEVPAAAREHALLRRIGERLLEMLDGSAFGAALVGPEGAFLHANPSLVRMLGRSQDEVLGARWAEVVHGEDLAGLDACLRAAIAGSTPTFEMDVRLLHADGGERWAFLAGGLVRDPRRRPLAFAIQVHDIGARKLEEAGLLRTVDELRESEERKSRFVAEASHELRTPLTSMLGFAKTVSRHWDRISEGDKRDYIALIADQGERLSRLIGDLLTLSRMSPAEPFGSRSRVSTLTTSWTGSSNRCRAPMRSVASGRRDSRSTRIPTTSPR